MKDEIKEIYLSNLEWTKTHDNMGGVNGNITFKNSISLKEFEKILENTYVILCDKDYITNLQEEVEDLRRIFGTWNNRKLIKKFNKEYDKEDKNKNPNRNYVAIYPDAEEVYKRYYDYKSRNEKAIEYIKKCTSENDEDYMFCMELLNILNGGVEE